MNIIRYEDLTTAERSKIVDRYAPYHRLRAFRTGYDAYMTDVGRYRCPYGGWCDVFSQAWHHGHDAAMHVRWQRKLPARDEYESDDRDSAKMCRGLEAGIAAMKRKGTLPARKPRPCELRPA